MFPITRPCFSDTADSYKEDFFTWHFSRILVQYSTITHSLKFCRGLATLLALVQSLSYLVEFGGSISDNSYSQTKGKY